MDKSRQLQNTIDMEEEERRLLLEWPSAARSWIRHIRWGGASSMKSYLILDFTSGRPIFAKKKMDGDECAWKADLGPTRDYTGR